MKNSHIDTTAASTSPPSTPSTVASSLPPSPFFAPSKSSTTKGAIVRTPGGTKRYKRQPDVSEHKATILGTSANLINAIVGAGIVGIPFAIHESGLVAGVVLVVGCAVLTEKSLRLLIETAKHIDAPSYETLAEASFGKSGFLFISLAMFIMAYGAMVSYMMIIKDTLPLLLGFSADDVAMKRAVLTVSSLVVILPLSMQRDMADLAKTSRLSVLFDIILVLIVATFSPVSETADEMGGLREIISDSTIHPSTVFIGLGVLSFAFVCQHSSFIIAGSLHRPTKKRWSTVTRTALITCGTLATVCGVCGYLGFLDATQGNIMNNFESLDDASGSVARKAAGIARGLLCTTMFFVYPMESFVARHVCVVLFFKGRSAHEGDDHAVLARRDRRVSVTVALYILALVPALLFRDLGSVLAVTGAIGGSSLSYIGPGMVYLGVHGREFLDMVQRRWGVETRPTTERADPSAKTIQDAGDSEQQQRTASLLGRLCNNALWYILLMPVWCLIATVGERMLQKHEEEEALKSPHVSRLGKVLHHHQQQQQQLIPPPPGSGVQLGTGRGVHTRTASSGGGDDEEDPLHEQEPLLMRANSLPRVIKGSYGGAGGGAGVAFAGNRGIAAAIAADQKATKGGGETSLDQQENGGGEEDPQNDPPAVLDFVIAGGFVIFGVVAMSAGLFSIFV